MHGFVCSLDHLLNWRPSVNLGSHHHRPGRQTLRKGPYSPYSARRKHQLGTLPFSERGAEIMSDDTKVVGISGKRPPRAGMGRPAGIANKTTRALKEALLESFDRGGGVDWLLALMQNEPKTYTSLLARLIPTESSTKMEVTNELTDDERRARIAAILDAGRSRGA